MHKRELNIIVNKEDNAIKRGDFFEEIVSNIFKTQRYTIKERVNFTGMEIDLIAQHIDRKNEIVYIECKARQSLEAKDIKSFAFNTKFKDAQYGYFLSTTDYAHQVAGLIEEMNQKKEYNNLYFWGPTKIIELLEDAKIIKEVDISKYKDFRFVKEILVYSYFGIYRVFIMQENTLNNQFTVMDAKTNKIVEDEEKIELIYNHIEEIKDLEYVNIENEKIPYDLLSEQQPVEKVAELKQSDNWFDYLPTAGKHFVGRKDLIEDFFGFLNSVRNNETDKRVFYIDGKSGWGKSSFISAIRDKSKNRYNKKKFFIFAVDTRSASTNNFIGLSLKKMIEKSIAENFINKESQSTQVEIGSNYDILNSSYIEEFIKYLKDNNKYLILIFDQFEDIFKKEDIFKVFYKFLTDINNLCGNILLGFSWKTEINVPIDNEAYYLWQTMKEYTFSISMREFDASEVNGVINQLQNSIGKNLDPNIRRRIVEGSQGFPWLTKKLCIHMYNQIKSGKTFENLLEQELNIKALFEKELEDLNSNEIKALKYIAKRAFDGNMFDATEIDDVIDNQLLMALINKRLVIQSGTKYNIYWDIFRDYLVTDDIPLIGESYLLRQHPVTCLNMFLLFKGEIKQTPYQLSKKIGNLSEKSTDNVMRELINLGLVVKEGNYYKVVCGNNEITKDYFVKFMREKFQRYTPYLKLQRLNQENITIGQIEKIFKDTFKGNNFKNRTWGTYIRIFLNWIRYVDDKDIAIYQLTGDAKGRILPNKKVKDQLSSFTPQKKLEDDIKTFYDIVENVEVYNKNKNTKSLYDLSAIGLLYYWGDTIGLTKMGREYARRVDDIDFKKEFCELAKRPYKINKAVEIIKDKNIKNITEFKAESKELVENINSKEYKKASYGKIYNWAKFIIENS